MDHESECEGLDSHTLQRDPAKAVLQCDHWSVQSPLYVHFSAEKQGLERKTEDRDSLAIEFNDYTMYIKIQLESLQLTAESKYYHSFTQSS